MLRPLTLLVGLVCFASQAWAITADEARALYAQRGTDFNNAKAAAEAYAELAANETVVLTKAQYTIGQSEALYYYAVKIADVNQRLAVFENGLAVAKQAADLLAATPGVAKQDEYKTDLARAYYFYASHLGRWGEARGVLVSLGKWPELKQTLFYITSLNEAVEDFGAYRVLGKAYMKIPFESKAEGIGFLAKAYDQTVTELGDTGLELSRNGNNNLFYLNGLKQEKIVGKFCEVYESFKAMTEADEDTLRALSPEYLPENKDAIESFKSDAEFKDLHGFYNEQC